MKRTTCDIIRVFPLPGDRSRGTVEVGNLRFPCALGRAGTTRMKREGDGCTRTGTFGLIAVWYRRDRMKRPRTLLPLRAIRPDDGWCDAPDDPRYNRHVKLPRGASHEKLWRDDHLYDAFIDLSVNRRPTVRGRGSALFLHIARHGLAPTRGCIAVAKADMIKLLARLGPQTRIEIRG